MSSPSHSSSSTMHYSSSSSSKDYSSALGSLMSTYGTSGTIPTPVHLLSSAESKSSSGLRRDGLSPPPPTPSQSCTSLLLHDKSRRSSLDSQRTLSSDSESDAASDTEDALGDLQSQYGLGSFGGAGMLAPTPTISCSASQPRRRKARKGDSASTHSESSSKIGSLFSRYGFGGSSILSRDSR
ncbi:hypothetical protein SCHPADRAFT_640231 [Schizopora paradoxa]|uniref:Uncharacterized protein n=1 Tax=Schizopora paradoxa TaxID=27342 RepID=A0A0H2RS28_9AGAM|nr:hypothetical protein SCHPADRAFT_640231 [Schizopora paradoxa]